MLGLQKVSVGVRAKPSRLLHLEAKKARGEPEVFLLLAAALETMAAQYGDHQEMDPLTTLI